MSPSDIKIAEVRIAEIDSSEVDHNLEPGFFQPAFDGIQLFSQVGQSPVIELDSQSRGQFIARTYAHLFGAIVAFTGIEVLLFKSGVAESITKVLMGT